MSIMEIEKNKKYRIDIPLGYNGNKRIRHIETFTGGKKDAKLREAELKVLLKQGNLVVKNNITVNDLAQEYLKIQKDLLSPSTYRNYVYRLKIIGGKIGYIKIQQLSPKVLDDFYAYLRADYVSPNGKKLSATTIQHYYILINNMLKEAVKWNYISYNPNSKIKKPHRNRTQIQFYTPNEVEQLVAVLKLEPIKTQAIIMLALDLGCRRGELLGLTWDDVDLKTGRVCINKSVQSADGQIFEKETKTPNADRINYISHSTCMILKKYHTEQLEQKFKLGPEWHNTNRIFTTFDGLTMHPDTPTKILYNVQKKYNLKKITFHGLRHTNVSLMISQGIQTQIISRKVGHASIQTTDKIYSHFYEDEFKAVANVMENFLENTALGSNKQIIKRGF